MNKSYKEIFDTLFSNEELESLLSPFKTAYENKAFDQLEGQFAIAFQNGLRKQSL